MFTTAFIMPTVFLTTMPWLSPYLSALETERAIGLLDTYGLEEAERKKWDMDFEERLFHPDFAGYFRTCLTPSDINKIQANSRFM